MIKKILIVVVLVVCVWLPFRSAGEADPAFRIFCFPAGKIPVIDGNTSDWDIVPESYTITIDAMVEDEGKYPAPDKTTLDIRVKVGWAEGENKLWFLYEAYDNYWSFSHDTLLVDMFEVIVDGDRSGGPFIDKFYPFTDSTREEAWELFHGRHAQNYHIHTPPFREEWCWYWGPQQWLKEPPWAKAAYNYQFKEGESGRLALEFYITPFDYASPKGPEYSVPSELYAGKKIGLCWAVIDYDNSEGAPKDGFWNLSKEHTMYGNADYLPAFILSPPEQNK